MKPTKLKMEDILIPGAKLTAYKLKETPELLAAIKKCNDQQEAILKQKEIDMNKVKNTYITI